MADPFKAYRVEKKGDTFIGSVRDVEDDVLPADGVLIEVAYSALNYKDALSAKGHPGVSRIFPHTPGIDASGSVLSSDDDRFKPGDQVLVTGYDLGMNTPGGFSRRIRVPADWIVPLPGNLSLREAMVLGTAGFTAGLGLHAMLHQELTPQGGPVLVTGATGGVGTVAVALLHQAGFEVEASTGSVDQHAFLEELGAAKIIPRSELEEPDKRPLLSARWQAAIDNVGGTTLENILKSMKPYGLVASVGLVSSPTFSTSVYPFILRSTHLAGIASADTPMTLRRKIWDHLAGDWKPSGLDALGLDIGLKDLGAAIEAILKGETRARNVLDLSR